MNAKFISALKKRPLLFCCTIILFMCAILLKAGILPIIPAGAGLLPSTQSTLHIKASVYKCDSAYLYLKDIEIIGKSDDAKSATKCPGVKLLLPVYSLPSSDKSSTDTSAFNNSAFNNSASNNSASNNSASYVPVGCQIELTGLFRPFTQSTNPGEFDSRSYYSDQNIYGTLSHLEIISVSGQPNKAAETFRSLNKHWENRLYEIYPEAEASVLSDLLLGNKRGMDADIKALYQRNGIAHILSISSLHISILGFGLAGLLRRSGLSKNISMTAGAGLLIFYGILTGMSVSAVRAIGMYLLGLTALYTGRTVDRLTSLSLLAAIIVLINPTMLRNSGFLLSFGAVLGICIMYPALKTLFTVNRNHVNYYESPGFSAGVKKAFRNAALRLCDSLLGSISIVLTTLPVQLYFFYEVPVYGVFINLIILPLMSLVMISGLIAMLIPGLGLFGTPAYWLLKLYTSLCLLFDELPYHTWNPGRPSAWQLCIYIVLLLAILAVSSGSTPAKLPFLQGGNLLKKIFRPALFFAILFSMFGLLSVKNIKPGTLVFLDVGQGDCCLIYTPAGSIYLIDGGSSTKAYVGEKIIRPALKYYGFSQIDGIFVSHSDKDHCNGILELIDNDREFGLKIKGLYLPGCILPLSSTFFSDFLQSGIPVYYICEGDCWQSGDFNFYCLHPSADFRPEDTNSSSECLLLTCGSSSVLFVGDIEGKGESLLTDNLKKYHPSGITVLKVAHHGSKYSGGDGFMKVAQPQYSIISVDANNKYKHPHPETIDRLTAYGSSIFITAESGAVFVSVTADGVTVTAEK